MVMKDPGDLLFISKKASRSCTANAQDRTTWVRVSALVPSFYNGSYEQSFSEREVVNTSLYHYIQPIPQKAVYSESK
jgi:hypothetical protein